MIPEKRKLFFALLLFLFFLVSGSQAAAMMHEADSYMDLTLLNPRPLLGMNACLQKYQLAVAIDLNIVDWNSKH